MDYQLTDAAYEGFRIVRERPRTIGVMALIQLVVSILVGICLSSLSPEARAAMGDPMIGQDNPIRAVAMLGEILRVELAVMALLILQLSVVNCALYRMILRPDDRGLFYFRLGGDELKMLLSILAVVAVMFGASIASATVFGIAGAFLGAVGLSPIALSGVSLAGMFMVLAWLAVRLSLAGPMTFTDRRVRVFEAWAFTRGSFWKLFRTYLVSTALAAAVWALAYVIFTGVTVVIHGGTGALKQLGGADLPTAAPWASPISIAYLLMNVLVNPLVYPVIIAPPAVIWRRLQGARMPGARL